MPQILPELFAENAHTGEKILEQCVGPFLQFPKLPIPHGGLNFSKFPFDFGPGSGSSDGSFPSRLQRVEHHRDAQSLLYGEVRCVETALNSCLQIEEGCERDLVPTDA